MLAIADDLTGALEVGAKFAGCGIKARVSCRLQVVAHDVDVLVLDTETRHVPAAQAAATVRDVAECIRQHAPGLIYKKTDSTLRGNIAVEFQSLLNVFPERRLLFAPAYPAMGRTVRDGKLLVRGVPVHESEFAADLLNPVHESDIKAMLGRVPAIVMDSESEQDVLAIAREIAEADQPLLVAGSAALAGALAECLPWPRALARPLPVLQRCLVVNGSLHSASAAQIDFARKQDCLNNDWQVFHYESPYEGLDRAAHIGEQIRRWLMAHPVEAIIVFGGDTTFGIQQALDVPEFDQYGEVLPGVPLSRGGGLFWITKAGGFGNPDLLCEIRTRLT